MAAHRIKELRATYKDLNGKKLSGYFIAQRLGITPQYFYDIEKGERNLSAEKASKLADIFGVTVDYLIGKDDIKVEIQKDSSPAGEESSENDDIDLPIEDLIKKNLSYAGRRLSEEQKERFAKFVQAGADLLK